MSMSIHHLDLVRCQSSPPKSNLSIISPSSYFANFQFLFYFILFRCSYKIITLPKSKFLMELVFRILFCTFIHSRSLYLNYSQHLSRNIIPEYLILTQPNKVCTLHGPSQKLLNRLNMNLCQTQQANQIRHI